MAAGGKLLRSETFIRLIGILLVLSPFFNILIVSYAVGAKSGGGLPVGYILNQASALSWVLWIATFSVGLMMVRVGRAAWVPVLMILAAFIAVNLITAKKVYGTGTVQPYVDLSINGSLFALILFQLLQQRAMARAIAAKPPVSFEGLGTWAHLLEVGQTELTLHAGDVIPDHIESRTVEIQLGQKLVVRARLIEAREDIFRFQYVDVDDLTREKIASWRAARHVA